MGILSSQADLTLATTAAPLVRQTGGAGSAGGSLRRAVELLVREGVTAVQLDLALSGIRPRELSRRGRQDLAAMLARVGAHLAGVELFLPRRHYLQSEHVDRAMAATLAAVEMAADLGRVPLSLSLPVREMADDAKRTIVDCAAGRGVRLAVHAEEQLDELRAWIEAVDQPALGVGLDPAALLALGQPVDQAVHALARRLTVARLADIAGAAGGGLRCPVGRGELDVLRYRIAVQMADGRAGPLVLDLRGLEDPLAGIATAMRAWSAAAPG